MKQQNSIQESTNPFELLSREMKMYIKHFAAEILAAQGKTEVVNDILNIDECVALTRLSKSKLYQLTSKHEIPFFKQGSRVLFSRVKILAWLNQFDQMDIKSANESADEFMASKRK